MTEINAETQTPIEVCKYMVSMVPSNTKTVLEPTPGSGNLVRVLKKKYKVIAPTNFFEWKQTWVDCVVMNPPFSRNETNLNGAPAEVLKLSGTKTGYYFLFKAMDLSDNIIAIMPWYFIINSKSRVDQLMRFGLVSITNLSRTVFKKVRVQMCVIRLKRGYTGKVEFLQL